MSILHRNISVQAIIWFKEKGYIKVLNPITNRVIYLSEPKAKTFELLDKGYTIEEVIKELGKEFPELKEQNIEEIIKCFIELNLVQYTDQFENQ